MRGCESGYEIGCVGVGLCSPSGPRTWTRRPPASSARSVPCPWYMCEWVRVRGGGGGGD